EKELAKEYNWKYYIPEAGQIEEVKVELKNIREDRKYLKLEDITFIDPSMGSGHILAYTFDIFMQLYLEEGYTEREAAESIIENNLYGLDIDKRAYQLAYFSIMMKGRQYSRGILNKDLENNLYYFIDSKDINIKQIDFLGGNIEDGESREDVKKDILEIIELFKDGKEIGTEIKIDKEYNYDELIEFVKSFKIKEDEQLFIGTENIDKTQSELMHILKLAKILSNKYEIVVTNPPYLGRRHMGSNLTKYLDKDYKDTKADLFAVFMEKCYELLKSNGYYGMVNQHSWMFLSSFEKYRGNMISSSNIINMLHLGPRAFEEIGGEVVQSTTFIVKKNKVKNYIGSYIRLIDYKNAIEKKEKTLEAIENPNCGYYYKSNQDNFELIPGSPIAYWISNSLLKNFKSGSVLGKYILPKSGLATGDNTIFQRLWYEVNFNSIGFDYSDVLETGDGRHRWFLCNSGGKYRKWSTNDEYVVDWEFNGRKIKQHRNSSGRLASRPQNTQYYFKEGITWNKLSLSRFAV